jgi:cadmium resistance transport/sequestration family protein
MDRLVRAVIAGIASFAATNIDDIVILMLWFAQVNSSFRRLHIIFGQYLGFTALIVASLPGFLGGLFIPKTWIGLLGLVPTAIGIKNLVTRARNENQIQTVSDEFYSSTTKISILSTLTGIISPQTYKVAAITIANGGDNIGIYVPLFASSNLTDLLIILGVFFVMIGVWCCIAYQLTRHGVIATIFTRYGHAVIPFVFIGLGVYIFLESGTYQLLKAF